MSLQVHVPEDHGAVDVLATGADWVSVAPHDYPEDTYPNVWYWFCVRNASSAAVSPARITLSGLTAGPEPERVYVPFWSMSLWSRDGERWERVPPSNQALADDRVEFTADLAPGESVWIAETFPMPWEHCRSFMDHLAEIAEPGFELERLHLGDSEEGRPVLAARIANGKSRPALVLIGGQHAVEESGKLFCETAIEWLVRQRRTPQVRDLLSRHEIFLAPEVNPDGCYCGRMNTNARGVVMDALDDDSVEMRNQLRLADQVTPRILVNCHGWGNTIGTPPYEGWYRWRDEDPFFDHVCARVPGAATSTEHLLDGRFRLESYVREKFAAHAGILEINWNFYVKHEGSVVQPTIEHLRARSIEYFRAIATMED
ncbi:MAG TPA: M14 family zinc carboxypeptidase [Armatimonadota bacterium]|nr:M14 family zinc carboxypeptidase [Armatimonadota bacterium]